MRHFFNQYGATAPGWATDEPYLGRKLAYAEEHTQVELEAPADAKAYSDHEDLRVRVRHDFYLSVPYADKVFAEFGPGVDLGFGNARGLNLSAACTLTNEGVQDYVDVEKFPS